MRMQLVPGSSGSRSRIPKTQTWRRRGLDALAEPTNQGLNVPFNQYGQRDQADRREVEPADRGAVSHLVHSRRS